MSSDSAMMRILTVAYDANGNTLTDSQGRSFTWDIENRLVQAVVPGANGGTTTFKYDPFGRRIQKSGPNGTINYVYDGNNLVEEIDQGGNVVARYTQTLSIDDPLAELRSANPTYYEADGTDSITSLTSAANTTVATYLYDTFGNLPGSTGSIINLFRYTGREFDRESNLYLYRARYFDANTGRFVSSNPLGFWGGDANFYRYVWNSPTNFIDPSGDTGIGVSLGGAVEGGGVVAGAGAQASAGFGGFLNTSDWTASSGGFYSGGAFAGGPGWGASAPSGPSSNNWAFGAYAGGGASFWATNANNVCDLGGPFRTISLNAAWGWRALTLQVSYGKNAAGQTIVVFNYGGPLPGGLPTGGGFGGSLSAYNTYTVPKGRDCGCK